MFVVEDSGAQPSDPSRCSSITETFAWVRGLQFPITRVKTPVHSGVPPAVDMWGHWHSSFCIRHMALQPMPLEPVLEVTLDIVSRTQALALASHRERVLAHVQCLVASLRQETDDWYQSAPQHVARTLQPQGQPRFEVLAFLKLLSECGYSDVASLEEDF